MKSTLDRREFLTRTGLTLAVVAAPSGLEVLAMGKADDSSDTFSPTAWYTISPDNSITVMASKVEMGQGTHTALAMLVAEELEADWSQVRTEQSPVLQEYYDPPRKTGMVTAGSGSIRGMYEHLRKAGAAGREMLVQAAATQWKVPTSECEASQSQVHHNSSGRSLSYGELVEEASQLAVPEQPRLKEKSEFKLLRTPVQRLDLPDKINGKAKFGIDTFVPGMVYGAIARPPAYGAQVVSYDEAAAKAVPGVQNVVKIDRGVAVCADTLDAAWKGKKALNAQWDKGVRPDLNTQNMEQYLTGRLDEPGVSARQDGDVAAALEQADQRLEVEYFLPYLSHANMEPMNSTADVREDGCDLWSPTQAQTRALESVKEITGLETDQIHVHPTYLGCGLGRRAQTDYDREATELSKAVGRPVKLIWTREEDMRYGLYRPANFHRISGALDGQGRVTAWSHKVAAGSFFTFPNNPDIDVAAVSGLRDLQYGVPNVSVDYMKPDLPIPVTFWRSVGNSHNGFTVESFMDELAHAAGKDPVEFRLEHLKHDRRSVRVLELVAEKAGWGKPLKEGQARGVAVFNAFRSYTAQIAEISVDEKTGKIKVHRVVCAIDCGPYVNSDTVAAQMMGAVTMGLSAAFKEQIEFADGGVKSANFADYNLLRMSEAPEVETHIVDSDDPIGGVGEPGLPPTAPAVANAVFAATGVRIRRLPMTPESVLAELKKS
ncbi:MAG: xanthine dehydrogenase family protein molybdopterin-binding subunit [Acidobacteriota bacterium]|nr:xanthine dehydrogenase family protein molybdopterin-binding subunit [Acidobacteriota bacterium]